MFDMIIRSALQVHIVKLFVNYKFIKTENSGFLPTLLSFGFDSRFNRIQDSVVPTSTTLRISASVTIQSTKTIATDVVCIGSKPVSDEYYIIRATVYRNDKK